MGPFKVKERIGEHVYRLELPPSYNLHDTFHFEKLSLCTETDQYGHYPEPEPLEVDGELEHEVEKIVDSKLDRRYKDGIRYRVRWKGYDESHDEWRSYAELVHAKESVAEFHKKHPEAPRRINAALFHALPWRRLENLTEGPSTPYSWENGKRGR